jgi:hypothetical protein
MAKAVILCADGTMQRTTMRTIHDYSHHLHNDYMELLPMNPHFVHQKKKYKSPVCYVSENGIHLQLPANPWLPLLDKLGLRDDVTQIYGNIILVGEGEDGEDVDLDTKTLSLIEEYED